MIRERGISRIEPGGQLSLDGVVVHNIPPRVSEWLPELLKALYPVSAQVVRRLVGQRDPGMLADERFVWRVSSFLQEELFDLGVDQAWGETTELWSDADAEVARYAQHLAELAYRIDDIETTEDLPENMVDDLTSIGTSEGPFNASLGALAGGPAQLHRDAVDEPTVITLSLDANEWTDLDDRRTGVRSLAALAVLATGFDVRILLSPQLEQHLKQRYTSWYTAHLTDPRNTSHSPPPEDTEHGEATHLEDAWAALQELPEQTAKARLLLHLDPDSPREYRALARDDEIDLAAGSIEPYVTELQDLGLVETHTDRRYNAVTLTPPGATAVDELIAADGSFVHPLQSRLETGLIPTPQRSTSTVYRAHNHTNPPTDGERETSSKQSQSAEDTVAATGDPSDDAAYVQWLDGSDDRLDAYGMHNRYMAGRRGPGVTLVDDRIQRFDDGRVSYLSCFEDELLVMLQWGDVLPTLGRLAGALLSNKAMSKILSIDALGAEFSKIDDGVVEQLDHEVEDILRWGHQIGWLSDDDCDYDAWTERFATVKAFCLESVAELSNSDDVEARTELIKDLLGLITSVTHLYHAIDVDVTVNLRMPDMRTLVDDEHRLENFLGFLRAVVPKQTAYGIHSGYRTLIEDRDRKLKQRLPYEVDPSDPTTELTCSWILSGPSMTALQDEIEAAISAEDSREAIQTGEETAPVMEIPVMIGNSYRAIKDLVRRKFERKRYMVGSNDVVSDTQDDLERLTRLFIQILGDEDQPHRACPHDVAEAIGYIAHSTRSYDVASISDIGYGVSQLPADRLLPDVKVTVTKMLQVVLEADDPMGRSSIIDEANVSGSTYDRHIDELALLDVFEPRYTDGHRRWDASLEPWWSPHSQRDGPPDLRTDDDDLCWSTSNPYENEVVSQIALRFGKAFANEALLEAWQNVGRPFTEIERFLEASSRFAGWWPFIWGALVDDKSLYRGPPASAVDTDVSVALIGRRPDAIDENQTDLQESLTGASSTATAD